MSIVIEGAGSVTELNLREHDLVNLGLVTRIRAPWMLVADIERGGVFGSVIGTAHLLSADERALFRGFAINKFRGDVSLFDEGVRILEERTGVALLRRVSLRCRCALDAEDSLALETRPSTPAPPGARHRDRPVSASVERDGLPAADLGGLDHVAAAGRYDFIVLPGSKNTIADLAWLRADRAGGLDSRAAPRAARRSSASAAAIRCWDAAIDDPDGMESRCGTPTGSACCRR